MPNYAHAAAAAAGDEGGDRTNTQVVRELVKSGHTKGEHASATVIFLLCDILDELRQNAANRQKALDGWTRAAAAAGPFVRDL